MFSFLSSSSRQAHRAMFQIVGMSLLAVVAILAGASAARAQDDDGSCELMVAQAFDHLVSDQYRDALRMIQEAFAAPSTTPDCRAQCLQTQSCAYLRMGERAQAIAALTQLLSQDASPPYDGRMFPPAMNRLYRAVRDSFLSAGTMDIGTVAVLDFDVASLVTKKPPKGQDHSVLGEAMQMIITTDLIESTNLTVVDRNNMKDVLAELELSSNKELVNKENSIRFGELLNAHAFIRGQMLIFDGNECRVDVQVIHTATTRVFGRQYKGPFSGKVSDLLDLQRGVLAAVVESLYEFRQEVKEVGPVQVDEAYFDGLRATSRDTEKYLEIWTLQGKALKQEDIGNFGEARKAWEKILEIDETNKLARGRLWALKSSEGN